MKYELDRNGLKIGLQVDQWKPASFPQSILHTGQYCRLEPLRVEPHGAALYNAFAADLLGVCWTYLPYGPFDSLPTFERWMSAALTDRGTVFFAITDNATGVPVGIAAYLRISPDDGTIEVGHLNFSLALKRSRAATEAMFLMMQHAFDLGYRRYEWKCNALNIPSRSAAQRLGFSFEGVWRNAKIIKGRNRDTAWFSVTDYDWPELRTAFKTWLASENFYEDGRQKVKLSDLTRPQLETLDPVLEIVR